MCIHIKNIFRKQLQFLRMESPTVRNNHFLVVSKCGRFYVNFCAGKFRVHVGLLAKFEFPTQTPNRS